MRHDVDAPPSRFPRQARNLRYLTFAISLFSSAECSGRRVDLERRSLRISLGVSYVVPTAGPNGSSVNNFMELAEAHIWRSPLQIYAYFHLEPWAFQTPQNSREATS